MRKAIALLPLLAVAVPRLAEACGCFAPPDPATPIVQAGERILFSRKDGIVTAHIQIQYAGPPGDFGWLLPLPSQPELELGTDELFLALQSATAPEFRVNAVFESCGGDDGLEVGCMLGGGGDSGGVVARPPPGGGPKVVLESSIGPFDYAVLKADSPKEMLDWLAAHRYFVPAGTDDAVRPYIRGGAYFLALKLASGKTTGDIQPVVVKYASDLPMIPIILTSIGAVPDMGIQVFLLGRGRAIPRNYAHTVVNDAKIDWLNGAQNYNDVIIAATREAPGRHTFVTEYAGPSSVMAGRLSWSGRFGTEAALASAPTIEAFVDALILRGFLVATRFPSPLISVLSAYAPMPARLLAQVSPDDFYGNIAGMRGRYPEDMAGWPSDYQSELMAAEIFERVVAPTRAAAALFDEHPYLTRLFTTLSPANMTKDPVFSESTKLPPVSHIHTATVTYHCGGGATVVTEQKAKVSYRFVGAQPAIPGPSSRRIEALSEEGVMSVLTDNADAIKRSLATLAPATMDDGGCRVARKGRYGGIALLALVALWRWRAARRRP